MNRKYLIFFIVLTAILFGLGFWLSSESIALVTRSVFLTGILFMAIISLSTFLFSARFVNAENPNRFVRGIMGGTFLKFFLCIIAALVWLLKSGKHLHKPDLFALMGVYILYTVLESYVLSGATKSAK